MGRGLRLDKPVRLRNPSVNSSFTGHETEANARLSGLAYRRRWRRTLVRCRTLGGGGASAAAQFARGGLIRHMTPEEDRQLSRMTVTIVAGGLVLLFGVNGLTMRSGDGTRMPTNSGDADDDLARCCNNLSSARKLLKLATPPGLRGDQRFILRHHLNIEPRRRISISTKRRS